MTTREQSSNPALGICESCDSLAALVPVTDEDGASFEVCAECA